MHKINRPFVCKPCTLSLENIRPWSRKEPETVHFHTSGSNFLFRLLQKFLQLIDHVHRVGRRQKRGRHHSMTDHTVLDDFMKFLQKQSGFFSIKRYPVFLDCRIHIPIGIPLTAVSRIDGIIKASLPKINKQIILIPKPI